jgi:putative restriction endonuclease
MPTSDAETLARYVERFHDLNRDSNRPDRYPAVVLHSAPHKPLLLLAVLDRFAEGRMEENRIVLTPGLSDLFTAYWQKAMPSDRRPDIAMPFYHLSSEGFWHLIPREGHEDVVEHKRLRSIRLVHKHTEGARLDDELYALCRTLEMREALRRTLIETYFADDAHVRLETQGRVNEAAYAYSLGLLDQARSAGGGTVEEPAEPAARDQGFRRAVVEAYGHRCALSGLSVRTVDGLTGIDAAHIVPWSLTRNDDPRNGLALTKLCHWVFEQGLVTVTPTYEIRVSPELAAPYNTPGYLATLDGRRILLPEDERLRPDPDYLAWHVEERFRA